LLRSPQNFVLGAGVRQFFRKIQKPYYDAKVMERLIYPHNIFLNFWTEIGLFGMLSFVYLYGYLLRAAYQKYCQKDKLWGGAFLIMLSIMFVHGLIDVPYFKNDLAMLFWVLVALVTLPLKEKN
jgi:O-antigen ligase